jgi:hypothetical protein
MPAEQLEKLSRENGDYAARRAYLGVFLRAPDEAPTAPNHVGLLYVGAQNETRALHYVTTDVLIDAILIKQQGATLKPYVHAPLPLDEEDAIGVAGILAVSKKNGWRIRYGMNWPEGRRAFCMLDDEDGQKLTYGFGPDDGGLTCATFVVELLAGLGHNPAAFESWEPNREADLEWRKERLNQYERETKTKITAERIAEMRAQDPFYRLRPEEAAAAVLQPPVESWPCTYEDVKGLAEEVMRRFADAAKPNDSDQAGDKAPATTP